MKTFELMLLMTWLVTLIMVQFHRPTMSFINRYDFLGLLPGFFLFSPKPFYGFFKLKYDIVDYDDPERKLTNSEVEYIVSRDFIASNQKLIKCINGLCRSSLAKPNISNFHFAMLIQYILNDARQKSYSGKLQFFIIIATSTLEVVKFRSRYYDI